MHGDKNLGPYILEHSFYICKGFAEHLGNGTHYKPLVARPVHYKQHRLQYLFRNGMSKFKQQQHQDDPVNYVCLTKVDYTFLYRAIKYFPDKLSYFRQMCKIHKVLWKMQLTICCTGTFMNY